MRAVVKIGTSSLTGEGGELDDGAVVKLCRELADAHKGGHELVLVCSGAIAAGLPALGFGTRPNDIGTLQAIAAVGQPLLMARIGAILGEHDLVAGQVLLTPHDFGYRTQYLHARETLGRLLELGPRQVALRLDPRRVGVPDQARRHERDGRHRMVSQDRQRQAEGAREAVVDRDQHGAGRELLLAGDEAAQVVEPDCALVLGEEADLRLEVALRDAERIARDRAEAVIGEHAHARRRREPAPQRQRSRRSQSQRQRGARRLLRQPARERDRAHVGAPPSFSRDEN
jgi:hypothetical protein